MKIMNWVKESLKNKIEFFVDEKISMDEKNFYIVMISCIPVYIILALVFMFRKFDSIVPIYSIIMTILIFSMLHLAKINNQEKLYGTVFCIIVNFLINPLYFFITGDIFNGVTIFFTLTVIITVFLHTRSRALYPLIGLELLYDILIIVFTYRNKALFADTRLNANISNAVTSCFELVAFSVVFMCLYQTYIYNVAKKKLDEANRDISIAESSRTRFLANMTHEIRTPMNAIIGMTNLILKEQISDEVRDQITTVKTASTDLLRIINDILEFSKFDSGKVDLFNVEYSFSDLISGIVNSVSREYEKEHISLKVFVSSRIPNMVFGDDVRIRQVFNYILFSSLSRNAYGNVYIDIIGDVDEVEKTVDIECKISSTGTGFSAAELSSMFNAYSDYDSRQKSAYKGMGLELNICKAILNLMGGDLEVQSIEGIGTSIVFTFKNYILDKNQIAIINNRRTFKPLVYESGLYHAYPWQKLFDDFNESAIYSRNASSLKKVLESTKVSHIFVDEEDYKDIEEYILSFECEEITYVITNSQKNYGDFRKCRILRYPLYSLNIIEAINNTWDLNKYQVEKEKKVYIYPGARVLIVDDSAINLKVLESLLSSYEITPRMALSGLEALDILKREEFDLLLLDQKMPEFDGIDTIHALRDSDSMNKSIPAICVTADFGAGTKERLETEGFDDYLAKPVNLVYLDRVVNSFLPENLRLVKKSDKNAESIQDNIEIQQKALTDDNVPEFDSNIGIANLGGSKEAYIEVLYEYYKEGLEKLESVPQIFSAGDISLYTTNVHALKSSSATVGAMRISPMFKALEFAGKDNDSHFIEENSDRTFEKFKEVLEIVKEYLISENAFMEEEDNTSSEAEGEVETVNVDLLSELSNCITSMNLRRSEEIINEISTKNFGSEINKIIKDMKNSFDGFEYMEVKAAIEKILN